MSLKLNETQLLNQQFNAVKQIALNFGPLTPKDQIVNTKQELEVMQSKLKMILQKNSSAVLALATASKEIPKLINRCESLIPSMTGHSSSTQEETTPTANTLENSDQLPSTISKVRQRAASVGGSHHSISKFNSIQKFDERFKSGTLQRGSLSATTSTEELPREPAIVVMTQIKVRCKVPFGHHLFIRGEGAGLDRAG